MEIKLIRKNNSIRTKFILNPFLWFSLVWIFVLFLHTFNFSKVYPETSQKMYGFLSFVIITSLVLAIIYHVFFLKKLKHINISSKPIWPLLIFVYAMFIVEAVYSKGVPLLGVFLKLITYKSFGIPIVSGFMYSFSIFLSLICSLKLVYGEEHKGQNFIALLLSYGRFVLVYSRGGLIICVLVTFVIFMSKRRVSFLWIPLLIILGIIFLFLFNVFGNIRMGFAWNDSSYLLKIAQFNKKYANLKNFSWGLVYLDTPLGNLLYNEKYVHNPNDFNGLISQLLPSVVSEVLYPDYDPNLTLAIPNLTVASMFGGGYKFYGYTGMIAVYIEMVIITLVACLLTKKENSMLLGCSAFLAVLCALSFFDNMFYTAGNSFALLYLVIYSVLFVKERHHFNYNIAVSDAN